MRWSEEQTYQFVKIYQSHENLWNSKHEHYRTPSVRLKSYRNFISELRDTTGVELNVPELKIKIKNLRSTYMQELTKIKRRSGPTRTFKSTLKWFAEMHKCFSNMSKEPHSTSFHDQQDSVEDTSEVWVSQTTDCINDANIDPFPDEEDYNIILKVEPSEPITKVENSTSNYKVKKKKMKRRSPSMDFSDRTYRGSIDSAECNTKDDEFDIYGKYIASQLRKMDLQKALRVQLEIQSLVSEARMSDLSSKH